MTELTRRGALFSLAAVMASAAMPTASVVAASVVADANPLARVAAMLAMPLEGDLADGAAFAIMEDEIKEFFGHRSNIDWPDGDYGAYVDDVTGNMICYRVPQHVDATSLWSREPSVQYRRPNHFTPLTDEPVTTVARCQPDIKPDALSVPNAAIVRAIEKGTISIVEKPQYVEILDGSQMIAASYTKAEAYDRIERLRAAVALT